MFDFFCIFTTGGVVLWCKAFVEIRFDLINQLIKDIIVEEKMGQTQYSFKDFIIKFKVANDLGIVFTAVYNKIIHLTMVDELVDMVYAEFKKKVIPNLDIENGLYVTLPSYFDKNFDKIYQKWDALRKEMAISTKPRSLKESLAAKKKSKGGTIAEADSSTTKDDEELDGQVSSSQTKLTKQELAKKKLAERFKNKKNKQPKKKNTENFTEESKVKQERFWGYKDKVTEEDLKRINRSKTTSGGESDLKAAMARYGPDEGDEDPDYWTSDEEDKEVESNGGLFSRFTERIKTFTGNKQLTEEDLNDVMKEFADGLMEKNVAQDIAVALCDSIKKSLVNTTTESFTTVKTTAKNALIQSLQKILTPKKKIDILKGALDAKKRGEPYKIVFIGVNGVGKSTSLAKVGYYLKTKGKLSPIIAACDNFRAGAVEQLKVHSKCLDVPLYQKGYKGDPANIAQEAIAEAKKKGYDVVLIDTAGRMQDNTPLMKALAKLIHVNNPDVILFVGEALVGNDATDQLTKFNQALIDYAHMSTNPRTIDGIILSKCDTVDDKIGASISMVYSTSKPIVFMGIGEKYPNLKKMNANTVINSLLS